MSDLVKRVILIGPVLKSAAQLKKLLQVIAVVKGDYILAVDGGLDRCLSVGIYPDLAVGDWDSSERRSKLNLIPHLTLKKAKNRSDLHFALRAALTKGPTSIVALGLFEGRPDHHLAALGELAKAPVPVWGLSELAGYFWVTAKHPLKKKLQTGQLFSVFTCSARTAGIDIRGAKYTLNEGSLEFSSQGLSNEGRGKTVEICVKSGKLLVIIPCQ